MFLSRISNAEQARCRNGLGRLGKGISSNSLWRGGGGGEWLRPHPACSRPRLLPVFLTVFPPIPPALRTYSLVLHYSRPFCDLTKLLLDSADVNFVACNETPWWRQTLTMGSIREADSASLLPTLEDRSCRRTAHQSSTGQFHNPSVGNYFHLKTPLCPSVLFRTAKNVSLCGLHLFKCISN